MEYKQIEKDDMAELESAISYEKQAIESLCGVPKSAIEADELWLFATPQPLKKVETRPNQNIIPTPPDKI